MRRNRFASLALALCGATLSLASAAYAADLTIALKNPNTHIDPRQYLPASTHVNIQIFEPLVRRNNDSKVEGLLAESWETPDPVTWIFHIRRNAKWHDGAPVTADDIAFNLRRENPLKDTATSDVFLSDVADVTVIDDKTVRLKTKQPAPTFLQGLPNVFMVSRKHGAKATLDDYQNGRNMVGSGPYKFVSYTTNDSTVMVKNPDYWGPAPQWDKVTYRVMTNDAARVAALQAGDVDVIESVPPQDIDRMKTVSNVSLWTRETSRFVHIFFDVGDIALQSGRITGMNGEKLDKNPFADRRVREAMKLAIDLDGFIARIYQGRAVATGQLVLASASGYDPDVKPWKPEVERARKLLEEAGWHNKFKLNLGVSTTTFSNAVPVSEALAQSWTRIGIPTDVTAIAYPVFVKSRVERTMPVYVQTHANVAGTAEYSSTILIHTYDGGRGLGGYNFTRYSNPVIDKLIDDGNATANEEGRAKLFREVAQEVAKDNVIVPLFLLAETTGTRKGILFDARVDQQLYVANVRRAN